MLFMAGQERTGQSSDMSIFGTYMTKRNDPQLQPLSWKWVSTTETSGSLAEIYPIQKRDGSPFSLAELFLVLTWGVFWGMFSQTLQNLIMENHLCESTSMAAEQAWSSSIRLLAWAWSQSYLCHWLVAWTLEREDQEVRSSRGLSRKKHRNVLLRSQLLIDPRLLPTQLLKSWLKQRRESLKAIS